VVIYDESGVGDMTECNIYISRQLAIWRMEVSKMEMHCYAFQV
jgi:hypothetical protein